MSDAPLPAQAPLCALCGRTWRHAPCFEAPCPQCGTNVGAYCQRPSGHSGPLVPFHAARDLAAAAARKYRHACGATATGACCGHPQHSANTYELPANSLMPATAHQWALW